MFPHPDDSGLELKYALFRRSAKKSRIRMDHRGTSQNETILFLRSLLVPKRLVAETSLLVPKNLVLSQVCLVFLICISYVASMILITIFFILAISSSPDNLSPHKIGTLDFDTN
jgi:hypothetical protein